MKIYDAPAIRSAVGFGDLIDPLATIFAEYGQGLGEAPIMFFAPAGPDGDVHVKSAWMPGRGVFTVKVASWFAARAVGGLSPNHGYIAVHDATTGDLLALLQDDHHLTDIRTAAAGALATRLLAPEDARTVAVLGTGTQAYLQALATCSVRPVDTVLIWGRNAVAARQLATALTARAPGPAVSVVERAEDAVRQAQIVVTATSSRQPIVHGDWLRPGQHVTAVGADDPAKIELDGWCFARADIVAVDSRRDTPVLGGDLRAAIDSGAIGPDDIGAEIGELVMAGRPARSGAGQITVAKLIGLGIQDLVAAEVALRLLGDAPRADRPLPASQLDLQAVRQRREDEAR